MIKKEVKVETKEVEIFYPICDVCGERIDDGKMVVCEMCLKDTCPKCRTVNNDYNKAINKKNIDGSNNINVCVFCEGILGIKLKELLASREAVEKHIKNKVVELEHICRSAILKKSNG